MAGAAVAAAREGDAPARPREAAEAVAPRRHGPDPPAGRGGVGRLRPGRAQDEEERAGSARRELQAAAAREVEPRVDDADERRERPRAQALLEGPEARARRADAQDEQAVGREPVGGEPVPVEMRARVGGDEEHVALPRARGGEPREQRRREAERRGHVGLLGRGDLVQAAEREAAGEVRVDRRHAEGQDAAGHERGRRRAAGASRLVRTEHGAQGAHGRRALAGTPLRTPPARPRRGLGRALARFIHVPPRSARAELGTKQEQTQLHSAHGPGVRRTCG